MKALSLFSGIGGIDLACEWAGIETIAFCEIEPYCQKVLRKHWPHVPIYSDVREITRERLEGDGIGTIDLIHGGYPCQPYSVAGKRRGTEDDRHLWPEVRRILHEIRPRWFVGENVAGHVTLGLDDVLADLDSIGYTTQAFIIPACAVGASHRRDRVFIVAYTSCELPHWIWRAWARRDEYSDGCQDVAYTGGAGCKKRVTPIVTDRSGHGAWCGDAAGGNGTIEPGVGRGVDELSAEMDGGLNPLDALADFIATYPQPALMGQEQHDWEPPRVASGVKNRTARLKALGNAVDPLQIFPVMFSISLINDWLDKK